MTAVGIPERIERRANECQLPGSHPYVWWCTNCNRLIAGTQNGYDKPDMCPLWACRERREKEARAKEKRWLEAMAM